MFQLSPLSKVPRSPGDSSPSPDDMVDKSNVSTTVISGDPSATEPIALRGGDDGSAELEGSKAGVFLSNESRYSSGSSCASCPEVSPSDLEYFEHIGAGHTSEVFRGLFRGKVVAIKQVNMPAAQMRDEAFAREVAIMCLVRHPNIVSLLGVVMDSLPMRIIMECCAGGSCFDFLHRQTSVQPTWAQSLKLCQNGAVAMAYLHDFEPVIIHRDLKSLNILLEQPILSTADVPCAKVADFGLARALDSAEPLTLGVGTNNWMAPEMFCRKTYDEKVDVYSYGMVLYEIVCRRIPFKGEEAPALRRLVLAGKRPDLSHVPSQCPDTIRALIVQCWAQDPSSRPDFEDVADIIKQAGVVSL